MTIEEIRDSFAGKSIRRVSFDLLDDQYELALELFRSRDVTEEEGFRVAAIAGLTEMKREAEANLEDDSLMKQLNRMESAYIGMANKAFALSKDNELMELSRNGWIFENRALTNRIRLLEEQLAALGKSPRGDLDFPTEQEPALEAPAFADSPTIIENEGEKPKRGWFGLG